MVDSVLNAKRNQQILAGIVRAYVATGEPVSSLRCRAHSEGLSPATIRNVMAELEEAGSCSSRTRLRAGCLRRRRTASSHNRLPPSELSEEDRKWIRSELRGATTPEEVTERAGHVLAAVSHGIGIIVMPPVARSCLSTFGSCFCPTGAWWWC